MELDHASHPDHKLSYRNSVKSDEEVEYCAACCYEISSEHYCCVECNYLIHKLCAERPQVISHSLHPLHPLHLHHKSPYDGGYIYCDACKKASEGFVYHCAICNFDLDLICAFPDGLKMKHRSHPEHVLNFEKGVKPSEKGLVCVLCSHHISGQSAELYSCRRCNVFLHKVCPEVPLELTHSSHIHPLQLIPWNPYSNKYGRCNSCYDVLNGALYHCNLCDFTLHLTCADPTLKPDYNAFPGTRKLNHVCHPHILTLENEVKGSNKGLICAACLEGISGPLADYYSCRQCNFFLHKLCSERPPELVHSFHPQHTLNLLKRDPYDRASPCDFCQKPTEGFIYRCQPCRGNFNLDFKCAFPKPEIQILEHVHPHQLILFPRDSKISCDLCSSAAGDEGVEEQSYACLTCDFMIHKSCAVTDLTQRYTKHKHPLSLVQGVTEDLQIYRTFFCDVCHNRISQEASVAHCALCRYFVHVRCMITGETDPIITIKDDVDYLDGSVIQFLLNGGEIVDWPQSDVSLELIQPFLLNKNGIVMNAQPKIRHFSHKEHDMILFEELHVNNDSFFKEEDEEILCDACIHPVTVPYYCCQDCNYYLHLPCANLPSKISHFSHDHELDLFYDLGCYKTFKCWCCESDCNGFAYQCKICQFYLDLTCAALPVAIADESHEHLLIQSRERTFGVCHCCQKKYSGWNECKTIFKCQYCEVYLHYRCAILTRSIRHRWDRQHPLDLRYPPHADHPDHIMCDMCEELVHPMRWLYSCFKCKVSFHIRCAPKYQRLSNIKYGGKVKIWSHPHILKHLKKATLKITCDMCGEALDSWDVFECETCYDCICRYCVAAEASSSGEEKRQWPSGEEKRQRRIRLYQIINNLLP